ncbi:MAG: phosphoribosylanthranilate isomerase [Candidatus Bathyarchaeia archaeon]
MNTIKVKICGITRREDLDAAVEAGADAVGFVVGAPASPRNLPIEKAEELLKQVPPFVKSVMVTVVGKLGELSKTCKRLNPDVVQIHAKTLLDYKNIRKSLNTQVIAAVNANAPDALEQALEASKTFDAVLLDSIVNDQYGGTGVCHNWELSKLVKQSIHPKPLIIAGGLNPTNVVKAVQIVQPYAVDVSSGVELKPGIKDKRKMLDFIKNAKGAQV